MTLPSFATEPRPIITRLLVGLNVAVFIATGVAGVSVIAPSGEALLRWGADFGPRTLGGEPWRLLTSTFLHFGIIHLALNMWCLWALGTLAEPLFGWAAFLLLYLLSGLGGSVLSMLVHPMVVSAGASGAVFGVAGGVITFVLRSDELKVPVPKNALTSVVGFVGYNLVYSFSRPHVDIAGHIGGLVVGLLLGAMSPRRVTDDPARLTVPSLTGAFAMALVIGYGAHRAQLLHPSLAALGRAERDVAAGAYDRAIPELDSALVHDPTLVETRRLLARAYGGARRWQEAVGELDTAIRFVPDDPGLFFERGNAQLELGHTDRAIEDYAAALRLAPRAAVVHYNLGIAYARRGDADSARAEFERALANATDDSLRRDAQNALTHLARASPPRLPFESVEPPATELAGGDAQLRDRLRTQLAQAQDSLDRGRYRAAAAMLRAVEREARGLAARYPDNLELPPLVADSRRSLARVRDACLAEQIVAERRGATSPACP